MKVRSPSEPSPLYAYWVLGPQDWIFCIKPLKSFYWPRVWVYAHTFFSFSFLYTSSHVSIIVRIYVYAPPHIFILCSDQQLHFAGIKLLENFHIKINPQNSLNTMILLSVHSVGLEINQANCKAYQIVNDRIRCSEIKNIF